MISHPPKQKTNARIERQPPIKSLKNILRTHRRPSRPISLNKASYPPHKSMNSKAVWGCAHLWKGIRLPLSGGTAMNTPEIPKEMAAAMLLMVIYFVNIYLSKIRWDALLSTLFEFCSACPCMGSISSTYVFAIDQVGTLLSRRVHSHGFEFKFVFIVMPNIWSWEANNEQEKLAWRLNDKCILTVHMTRPLLAYSSTAERRLSYN